MRVLVAVVKLFSYYNSHHFLLFPDNIVRYVALAPLRLLFSVTRAALAVVQMHTKPRRTSIETGGLALGPLHS